MIYQHIDRDSYTDSQNAERVLNAAIIGAEIADSYEEYLDIFEAFYADEIEVSGDTQSQPIRGKARVRALLFNFLVPLHVMAEVGGLSISIRETPIPGDAADETHSAWTLDLAAGSGAVCTLNWCVSRRWDGSRVVYERHYDAHQIGGPLTQDDLSFNTAETAGRSQRPLSLVHSIQLRKADYVSKECSFRNCQKVQEQGSEMSMNNSRGLQTKGISEHKKEKRI